MYNREQGQSSGREGVGSRTCRQRDVPRSAADSKTDLAGKARELFPAGYVYPDHSRAKLRAAAQDSADIARALGAACRCCREL